MPFARDLHPEFDYVGSAPRVFRRLGRVLSFAVFGIVAGASGVAVFMAAPDSDTVPNADPLHAMALAPAEALIQPTQSEEKAANALSVKRTDEEGAKASSKESSIKSACPESLGQSREGACAPVRIGRMHTLRAVNERPLIGAVPIGHQDDPTVLPPPPATPIAVSPSTAVPSEEAAAAKTSVAETTPADTAPAAEPAPATSMPTVTSKQPRPQVHHAQDKPHRRNHNSYESSYSARNSSYGMSNTSLQGGYARVW